jgi:predicted transcriptional regulator
MQIGATRQSVSTIIAGLIRDGFIRRLDGCAIAIPDAGRLKHELDQSEQHD